MAYDLLVVQSTVTIASDCTQATAVDSTGEYPAESGGFAPPGDGDADRPSTGQVWVWWMWRRMDSEGVWQEVIPESQSGDPEVTIPLTDDDGNALPDAAWQVIEMVVPDNSDWNDYDGMTFSEIIAAILAIGTLGQTPMFTNCTSVNCTNEALERLNNAWMSGDCETDEYATKKAFLQGATDSINLGGGSTLENVDSPATTEQYAKTQTIIDTLVTLCGDESCKCNC